MSAWAKIMVDWDSDPAIRSLSLPARHLFVVSFTHNKDAAMTGLSEISERQLQRRLSMNGDAPELLAQALEQLGEKPLVRYDFDNEVLWCVNRMRHACSESPRWRSGVERVVAKMPPSPLIGQFKRRYKEYLKPSTGGST